MTPTPTSRRVRSTYAVQRILLPVTLLLASLVAACGGGGDTAPEPRRVQYAGTTLLVDGTPFTPDPGDFIPERGRIHVFTSTAPAAQAEVSRFVETFGLATGAFRVIGDQPPLSSTAPVTVPAGFESQWAQALRATPPGVSALTRVPCC